MPRPKCSGPPGPYALRSATGWMAPVDRSPTLKREQLDLEHLLQIRVDEGLHRAARRSR